MEKVQQRAKRATRGFKDFSYSEWSSLKKEEIKWELIKV